MEIKKKLIEVKENVVRKVAYVWDEYGDYIKALACVTCVGLGSGIAGKIIGRAKGYDDGYDDGYNFARRGLLDDMLNDQDELYLIRDESTNLTSAIMSEQFYNEMMKASNKVVRDDGGFKFKKL